MTDTRRLPLILLAAASVLILGGVTSVVAWRGVVTTDVAIAASADRLRSEAVLASEAAAVPSTPLTVSLGDARDAPWDAPGDPVVRAAVAGFGMLGGEATEFHIHAHVTITVDGVAEVVPGEIGIDQTTTRVSPLHTHDTTGIVHIESPVTADFTLGQFFTEWNVALDASRVGGYGAGGPGDTAAGAGAPANTAPDTPDTPDAADAPASVQSDQVLTVFVNGTALPAGSDPAAIVFANKMDIDIVMHPAVETATAPAPFDWPSQY